VSTVADDAGFVVTADCTNGSNYTKRLVVTSRDGGRWASGPDQFKKQSTVAGVSGDQGSVLVTRTKDSDDSPDEYVSTAWSRTSGGDSDWTRGRPLDVGQIPDTGVAPRKQQSVNAVSAVPGGFIASGHSIDVRLGLIGALWTSPDGRRWSKQATKKNGFDEVFDLYGAAELDGRYILLGRGSSKEPDDPGSHLWLGDQGSAPEVEYKGGGPAAFVGTWTWGHGSLVIDREGHFTYRWRLFRPCETEPAPCDKDTVWGGKATGTLTGDGGTLRGKLSTTNRPDDPNYRQGATIEVKRMPYSAVFVRVDGDEHGYFCAAGTEDLRCLAPHE
jgi:hypothetical protein